MSRILALAIIGIVVCSAALFFLDGYRSSRMGDSCILPSQCSGAHDDCEGEWSCVNGDCVWECSTASEPEPPSLPGTCSSDSDCATGGCSGEICGLKEDVEGIVSTCIYLDYYACLKLTECGCVDGKCVWKENEDYMACMAEYK